MAVTNMGSLNNDAPKTKEENLQDDLLIGLAEVYAYVKSRELTKTLSSYTFDDYINDTKLLIKGDQNAVSKTGRPTKLDRLAKLESTLKKVIDQAKKVKQEQRNSNNNGGASIA